MIQRWMLHSYSLELRNLISYRVDFWVQFLGTLLVNFMVSYFLWSAIFEVRGVNEIGGYTFPLLMFYYILAPLIEKSTMSDAWTHISMDIYSGTLTRYIVYPLAVLPYKYMAHLAKTTIGLAQMTVTMLVLYIFVDIPQGLSITPISVFQSLVIVLAASYLFFIINLAVEMAAFWADNVWSLLVMVKFAVSLLGGTYFPLTLFPETFRRFLDFTPFSYFVSFPIRCFMNQVSWDEWWMGLLVIGVWSVLMTVAAKIIWAKGSRNYSGVGQ